MTSMDPEVAYTTSARLKAAEALRCLGEAFVSHQVDDAVFDELCATVEGFTAQVSSSPRRRHGFFQPGRPDLSGDQIALVPGEPLPSMPDCIISGHGNPMGVAATFFREDREAICRVELGRTFEGAPDRAHGGMVSAIFDHTMGLATAPTPAFTAWIKITYRAPTPLHTELEVRARVVSREGRKLSVTAEMRVGDEVIVEGEGLFIVFDLDKVMGSATDGSED